MKTRIMILAALALAVAAGPAVGQQITDSVQVHGFQKGRTSLMCHWVAALLLLTLFFG